MDKENENKDQLNINTLNFCTSGGQLVGSAYTIPDNPSDYADVLWGCNNLVCPECGMRVRNAPYFGSRPGFGNRAAEVYDTPDWRTISNDILSETPGYIGRFYTCRCNHTVECSTRLLDDDSNWETFDISHLVIDLPWRCAGHSKKVQ